MDIGYLNQNDPDAHRPNYDRRNSRNILQTGWRNLPVIVSLKLLNCDGLLQCPLGLYPSLVGNLSLVCADCPPGAMNICMHACMHACMLHACVHVHTGWVGIRQTWVNFSLLDQQLDISRLNASCVRPPDGADATLGGSQLRAKRGHWFPFDNNLGWLDTSKFELSPDRNLFWSEDAFRKLGGMASFCYGSSSRCCNQTVCSPPSRCSGHRTGLFCAQCKEGRTEVIGTETCILSSDCGSRLVDRAAWAVVFLLPALAVPWLMLSSEIHFFSWAKAWAQRRPIPKLIRSPDDAPSAVIDSMVLFYQLAYSLIQAPNVYSGLKVAVNTMSLQLMSNVLASSSSGSFSFCPWVGMTALMKPMVHSHICTYVTVLHYACIHFYHVDGSVCRQTQYSTPSALCTYRSSHSYQERPVQTMRPQSAGWHVHGSDCNFIRSTRSYKCMCVNACVCMIV